MRLRICGDQAVLVELNSSRQVLTLHHALRSDPPAGLIDTVPAARTVLVIFDPSRTPARRLAAEMKTRAATDQRPPRGPLVEIPVRYDGSDLADVASRTGMSVADVVARHTRPIYTVAFCGFAPGFGYVTGLDAALRLTRRDTPRVRVPAGAVAIADRYSGVDPRPAPGGWHILGHTDTPMWTLEQDPPALLRPGCRVRFVALDGNRRRHDAHPSRGGATTCAS
jgi:KipI family sensor histidine kinase inhibitor